MANEKRFLSFSTGYSITCQETTAAVSASGKLAKNNVHHWSVRVWEPDFGHL